MIDSCVLANDLKSASDFLMKMEASGHSPDTKLLDKVMELYSQQKVLREVKNEVTEGVGAGAEWDEAARTTLRTKLSSGAGLFVPSFVPAESFSFTPPAAQPPPPTGPK